MAKLNRVTGKIFGATASPSGDDPEIGQFGSAKAGTYNGTSDISTIQGLPAWSNGWIDAVTPSNQYPPLPERTGVDKVLSYQECYLLQQGIPEWDGGTTYYENGFCSYNGIIYKSLIDENLNNQPDTSIDAWEVYGAINDYANQDLQNLSDLGNSRLQYAPFAINSGTVVNGENNTLYSGSFIETYNTAGTYTLEITEAGDYEIELYGAGGGASYYQWAGTGSSVAARISTGGSGAGFKGVITLPIGTYTVTVGAAGADRMHKSGNYYDGGTASTGGATSLDSLIIAGGGTGGHAKPTVVDGVGGAVTIDAGATIVSTELNVSGNNGNRSYASGWTAPNLAGGRSVYDNTTTGYGAGGGKPQTAIDGFFGIKKVSGSAATLGCDVCTITTCDGRTKVNSEAVQQDVSTLADGTYSVFKNYTDDSLSILEEIQIGKPVVSAFVQPTLTANGTMGGNSFAVEADSENTGNSRYAYKAFDGVSSGYGWLTNTQGSGAWIAFYNPIPLNVTNLKITNVTGPSTAGYYVSLAGSVYGSNDGITWTELTTYTNNVTAYGSSWNIVLSTNTNYYKYYKITTTSVNNTAWQIAEISITAFTKWQSNVVLNTSSIPANLYVNGSINNDLVYIGECTIESGAITNIANRDFNDSGYLVEKSVIPSIMPDYKNPIVSYSSIAFDTVYQATQDSILFLQVMTRHNYIIFSVASDSSFTQNAYTYTTGGNSSGSVVTDLQYIVYIPIQKNMYYKCERSTSANPTYNKLVTGGLYPFKGGN